MAMPRFASLSASMARCVGSSPLTGQASESAAEVLRSSAASLEARRNTGSGLRKASHSCKAYCWTGPEV